LVVGGHLIELAHRALALDHGVIHHALAAMAAGGFADIDAAKRAAAAGVDRTAAIDQRVAGGDVGVVADAPLDVITRKHLSIL
jgi:hypothetical protein